MRSAWVVNAVYQAVLILVCCTAFVSKGGVDRPGGQVIEMFHLGTLTFTCVVVTVMLQLATVVERWTWLREPSRNSKHSNAPEIGGGYLLANSPPPPPPPPHPPPSPLLLSPPRLFLVRVGLHHF